LLICLTACIGSYGRLQRSSAVSSTFESHEVLADYRYYATGPEARPTAILAVQKQFTLKSRLWDPVEMTSARLKRMVDAMTDQLGFTTVIMGGVITDPEGRRAGLWYSPYSSTTIRFEPDNIMQVSLPSPASDPFLMDTGRHRR
jgi:hypothetical protein